MYKTVCACDTLVHSELSNFQSQQVADNLNFTEDLLILLFFTWAIEFQYIRHTRKNSGTYTLNKAVLHLGSVRERNFPLPLR